MPAGGSSRLKALFKYFNSFIAAETNSIDVLMCDEAHRIRQTPANRFTPATKRTGRLQVDELISVARVPVVLLDEHQVVRPCEIGTVEAIEAAASARGLRVRSHSRAVPVRRQRGVRGVGAAIARPGRRWTSAPEGDDRFEILVTDSPREMEAILRLKHDEGFSARMAAGFCWPWSDPRDDGTLMPDVRIDQVWAQPWNARSERAVGEAPGLSSWRRIRPALNRLDASIRRRGSSTTGEASSSDPTWWRGTARWSVSAGPTVIQRSVTTTR
jgi:hypothetical protein